MMASIFLDEISAVWAEVLQLDSVDQDTDFFAEGGDSLAAVQMVSKLAAMGVPASIAELFKHPTPAGYAAALSLAEPASAAVGLDGDNEFVSEQQLEWLYQLEKVRCGGGTLPSNVISLVLPGKADVDALRAAVRETADAHPLLHAGFIKSGGTWRIRPLPGADIPVTHRMVSDLSAAITAEAQADLDLMQPPLFQAVCLETPDGEGAVILHAHHRISDDRSMRLVAREVWERCRSLPTTGRPEGTFADFVRLERSLVSGPTGERSLNYWRETLSNSALRGVLPGLPERPVFPSYQAATVTLETSLPVRRAARELGTTPTLLLAGMLVVHLRRAHGPSPALQLSYANRDWAGSEGVVGLIFDSFPLVPDLAGGETPRAVIEAVNRAWSGAIRHRMPHSALLRALQPGAYAQVPMSPIVLLNVLEYHSPGPARMIDNGVAFPGLAFGASGNELSLRYEADWLPAGLAEELVRGWSQTLNWAVVE